MFEKFEEFEEFEEFECLKSSTFRVGGEESSATGITVIEEQPDIVEDMSALIEEFEEFEGFECSAFSVLCSALWVEDYSWVRIPVVGEQPYIAEEKLTLIEDRFF